MFANYLITRREFRVALPALSLVALSLSGCGWADNYAKPIHASNVKANHQQSVNLVSESFFTAEEKKVALEQLDRIQSAYLEMIETRPGEDWKRGWSYQVVTGDRLLAIAQVRAIRDEYLPPCGLSNEEKKQGVTTCNEAICALVANKLPLDLSIMRKTPSIRGNLLQYHLQFQLRSLPEEWKRHGKVVDPDVVLREALALLEETLAYAKEEMKFEIPEVPCQIDLAVKIQADVDEFLKELAE